MNGRQLWQEHRSENCGTFESINRRTELIFRHLVGDFPEISFQSPLG